MLNFLGSPTIVFLADHSVEPEILDSLRGAGRLVEHVPLSGAAADFPEIENVAVIVVCAQTGEGEKADAVVRELQGLESLRTAPIVCRGFSPQSPELEDNGSAGLLFHMSASASADDVLRMIESAASSSDQFRKLLRNASDHESAFGLIRSGVFEVKNLQQAEKLATILSRASPDPSIAAFALMEILINAIEHGNLGISNSEKSQLIEDGSLHAEIERRAQLPENLDKIVSVTFERMPDRAEFTVSDSGLGFDWRRYMRNVETGEGKLNGRGISLACALDRVELTYLGSGNTAKLVVR